IPTRYVTGFYAHETDGPGSYVVRDQDAHAWAESWVDGVGWVTVDATPASGLPAELAQKPPWWRNAWEWFTDIYYSAIRWARQRTARQWVTTGVSCSLTFIALLIWRRRVRAR